MLESEIQAKICDMLTAANAKWTKTKVNTRSGDPDLIVCYNGLYYGIEVKVPGKMPTELQTEKLLLVHKAGGIAFYAQSVEDVRQHMFYGATKNLVQAWYKKSEEISL